MEIISICKIYASKKPQQKMKAIFGLEPQLIMEFLKEKSNNEIKNELD